MPVSPQIPLLWGSDYLDPSFGPRGELLLGHGPNKDLYHRGRLWSKTLLDTFASEVRPCLCHREVAAVRRHATAGSTVGDLRAFLPPPSGLRAQTFARATRCLSRLRDLISIFLFFLVFDRNSSFHCLTLCVYFSPITLRSPICHVDFFLCLKVKVFFSCFFLKYAQ